MRLAWFAPQPDDVALELGLTHVVDQFDARRAHDFVWQHFRAPYDLTIVELADSAAHAYVWPYLFHYPGIVILRATSLHESRSELLTRQHRRAHLRAERAFGGPDLLRAPLAAARAVVVHDDAVAHELRLGYPAAHVHVLPVGVRAAAVTAPEGGSRFRYDSAEPEVVARAADRARDAGAPVHISPGLSDLGQDDVAITLEWPPTGAPPITALRAMAAGVPAVVFETEATATWPTLDPQTWQPRDFRSSAPPIAVSIDARDEEHSLMLAMRRLSSDSALRASLGSAARAWVQQHANVVTAAAAWEPMLRRVAARADSPPDVDLPAHLTEDGSSATRALLGEFCVSVDFLDVRGR